MNTSAQSEPSGVILYGRKDGGHREQYSCFMRKILDAEHGTRVSVLTTASPVLFLMIEENFIFYIFAAIFRALIARRTSGLLFRPLPAVQGNTWRLKIKRQVLKILKRMPHISTITILPFSVERGFESIADGWIYDFQLWDLESEDLEAYRSYRNGKINESDTLYAALKTFSGKRKLVCSIGEQSKRKGFEYLMSCSEEHESSAGQICFAYCGQASVEIDDLQESFQARGGFAKNRRITDEEIIEAYAASDIIWCAYAPYYDQASGILGRAIQLGVPVIVRKGSLIHRFCETEAVEHIAVEEGAFALADLPKVEVNTSKARILVNGFRERSMENIYRMVGIEPIPTWPKV